MAVRRKVKVPTIADMMAKQNGGATPYERSVVSTAVTTHGDRSGVTGTGLAAQVRAQRSMSYDTALAIQAAKEGDDSELLPYQPTPSINPPRPRTLAAGYDADTQTLRIRFRDGTIYEYYNVDASTWRNFKRVKSPGRAVNRVLNNHPYARATWS